MPAGENIKDDLKIEFKYILHSQKKRKKITVVGNLKNIRCSFAYPLFQNGNIVTCKVSFNIALCLLSNGVMLPPLVLTTMDKLAKFSDIPVLKVSSINFTLLSFQYWITSVWQKRNGQNIQSLLVTSTQLPSGVAKLLRRYNTELIIVPDLVKSEVEPLDEVWCNKFRTEITESYLVWAQQCNAFMLPLETFCKMVYSAWIKCRVTANFDKLFLEDEDSAIATILEEQLDQQKQWMRKPNCTAEESKLKFEIIEVFQCTLCANLFHIDECGKHTLREVVTFGSDVLPKYRRLVGIGTETHFTCFVEHDNGTLVCEICAEDFSRECWAAHHILKHLQQKWCRVCFRQLFVCQEHKCLQNESELTVSVIEEERTPASEDQPLDSNQSILPEVLSSNTAELALSQHKDLCVENVNDNLEDIPIIEEQLSENTEIYNTLCISDVQSLSVENFVNQQKRGCSEHEDENAHTFACNNMCSPQVAINDTRYEESLQDYIRDIEATSTSENMESRLKKARSTMHFELLEFLSINEDNFLNEDEDYFLNDNEDYFLNDNESNKCNINPQFFHMEVVSSEETGAVTNQSIPQDCNYVDKNDDNCVKTTNSSLCSYCNEELVGQANTSTHVCKGIYVRNGDTQLNVPKNKQSALNRIGTRGKRGDKKLHSELDIVKRVCRDKDVNFVMDIAKTKFQQSVLL